MRTILTKTGKTCKAVRAGIVNKPIYFCTMRNVVLVPANESGARKVDTMKMRRSSKRRMNRGRFFVFLVAGAIAVSAVATSCINAQAQGGSNVKSERWEYKVMSRIDMSNANEVEAELNRLGMEGWEVVSAGNYNGGANSSSYNSIILKRKSQ